MVPKSSKTLLLNSFRRLLMFPPLEKALSVCVRGRSADSFIGRFVPNHYQYPEGSMRDFVARGIRYEVDIADITGWFLYFGFRVESMETLFRLARPGFVVLDIGTNIGDTLLPLAQAVGVTGKVFGFEPDPVTFARCESNLALNGFKNCEVTRCALGPTRGKASLHQNSLGNRGAASLVPLDSATAGESVEVGTVDDFVIRRGLERLDLIKIDVEGYEGKVLDGSIGAIARFRPKLFIEMDDSLLRPQGWTAKELVRRLADLNYHVVDSESFEPISHLDSLSGRHCDLVCTPEHEERS